MALADLAGLLGAGHPARPAAEAFVDDGDRDQARTAFARAAEIYTSLGAVTDVARLKNRSRLTSTALTDAP